MSVDTLTRIMSLPSAFERLTTKEQRAIRKATRQGWGVGTVVNLPTLDRDGDDSYFMVQGKGHRQHMVCFKSLGTGKYRIWLA